MRNEPKSARYDDVSLEDFSYASPPSIERVLPTLESAWEQSLSVPTRTSTEITSPLSHMQSLCADCAIKQEPEPLYYQTIKMDPPMKPRERESRAIKPPAKIEINTDVPTVLVPVERRPTLGRRAAPSSLDSHFFSKRVESVVKATQRDDQQPSPTSANNVLEELSGLQNHLDSLRLATRPNKSTRDNLLDAAERADMDSELLTFRSYNVQEEAFESNRDAPDGAKATAFSKLVYVLAQQEAPAFEEAFFDQGVRIRQFGSQGDGPGAPDSSSSIVVKNEDSSMTPKPLTKGSRRKSRTKKVQVGPNGDLRSPKQTLKSSTLSSKRNVSAKKTPQTAMVEKFAQLTSPREEPEAPTPQESDSWSSPYPKSRGESRGSPSTIQVSKRDASDEANEEVFSEIVGIWAQQEPPALKEAFVDQGVHLRQFGSQGDGPGTPDSSFSIAIEKEDYSPTTKPRTKSSRRKLLKKSKSDLTLTSTRRKKMPKSSTLSSKRNVSGKERPQTAMVDKFTPLTSPREGLEAPTPQELDSWSPTPPYPKSRRESRASPTTIQISDPPRKSRKESRVSPTTIQVSDPPRKSFSIQGAFDSIRRPNVTSSTQVSLPPGSKSDRFTRKLVPSVQYRPKTLSEVMDLLYCSQEELDELAQDRDERMYEKQFEVITGRDPKEVAVTYPLQRVEHPRQPRVEPHDEEPPGLLDISGSSSSITSDMEHPDGLY